MLIIQKPKNKENYIKVSDALNRQLQEAGYQPIYKDKDGWYYLKTKEIKSLLDGSFPFNKEVLVDSNHPSSFLFIRRKYDI